MKRRMLSLIMALCLLLSLLPAAAAADTGLTPWSGEKDTEGLTANTDDLAKTVSIETPE